MISVRLKGDFSKTEKYFSDLRNKIRHMKLESYARQGVEALSSATPVLTGKTAASWDYTIEQTTESATITFQNTNINKGVNIAIILQMGHGTRNGGYVRGRDYINPAIQPIFDKIAKDAWEEVIKL